MAQVKEGDFVLLDFTGRVAGGSVFETTLEPVAKKEGISAPRYGPALVVAGKGQIISGLDKALVGCEAGVEKSLKIAKKDAYGERDPSLVRLLPLGSFKKQGIVPHAGMELELDQGLHATVVGVDGGRVRVDLNPPLAGQDLEYSYKVTKIFSTADEKVKIVAEQLLGANASVSSFANGVARLGVGDKVAKASQEFLQAKLRSIQLLLQYAPEVKKVVFEEEYALPKEGA
ncbi:MAG: peptidylprolyl isomerase [Candidatus Micrarchaeia archaeon]